MAIDFAGRHYPKDIVLAISELCCDAVCMGFVSDLALFSGFCGSKDHVSYAIIPTIR